MADQTERIVLEIDDAKAILATARTNAALERLEKRAGVAIGSMGRVSEQMQRDFIRTNKAADDMAKKMEALGGIGGRIKSFLADPLGSVADMATGAAKSLGALGSLVVGVATAVTGFAVAGFSAAKSLGEYGDRIGDISIRTGLTTREVSQFSFAMKRAGGDIASVETAMRMLSKGLADTGDEGKTAREGLAQLGISARDIGGNLRPMSAVLIELSAKLGQIEGTANRNTLAMKVMGRSALELLPDLLELSEGVARAKELGLGKSEQEIKRLQDYQKWVVEVEAAWDRLARKVKEPLAGAVVMAVEFQRRDVGQMDTWDAILPWGDLHPNNVKGITFSDIRGNALKRQQEYGLTTAARAAERLLAAPTRSRIARDRAAWEFGKEGSGKLLRAAQQRADAARGAWFGYEGFDAAEGDRLREVWRSAEAEAAKYETRLKAIKNAEEERKKILEEQKMYMADLWKSAEKVLMEQAGSAGIRNTAWMAGVGPNLLGSGSVQSGVDVDAARLGLMDWNAAVLGNVKAKTVGSRRGFLEHQIRMSESGAGRGSEVAAIERVYQLRLQIAQVVGDQAAIAEAGYQREESLLELQRNRVRELETAFQGMFEAAFAGARSFFDALKRFAIASFVTPFTKALSSSLANAVYGGGGGGWGGMAAGLGGMFGGGGAMAGPGAGAMTAVPGMVGVGMGAGGQLGSLMQGGGGIGLGAALGARGGAVGGLGMLGAGGAALGLYGAFKMGQSGNPALKALAPGLGAVSGLLGFGALANMFPALIGLGPAGWIAAAGIGAFVGMMGLFRKTSEQKVVEKVQALYGIKIDRALASQIVELAKSSYGGNLDMAIRTPQIRELVELYAMATSQSMTGAAVRQFPTTMAQSYGSISTVPNHYNGSPYTAPVQTTAFGGSTVTVQLDPQATREFLSGRMATSIAQNPRAVGTAVVESGRQSVGRRELAAQVLSPGLVLS